MSQGLCPSVFVDRRVIPYHKFKQIEEGEKATEDGSAVVSVEVKRRKKSGDRLTVVLCRVE